MALIVAMAMGAAACSGGDTEFEAMDAQAVADVVDAALTEESGLRGFLSASDFTEADVDEFNEVAESACADLSDGIAEGDFDEFRAGVMEGAGGVEDMIDVEGLAVALVEASCPSYLDNLNEAIGG